MYVLFIAGAFALSVLLSLLLLPDKPAYFFGPFFAIAAFIPTVMLLSRKIGEKVRPFFDAAQQQAKAGNLPAAIESLEKAKAYKNWQLLLERQVNSEIGLLHYAQGKEKEAVDFLRRGYPKVSTGHLVLGAALYRDGGLEPAREALEQGIRFNKKSPVLYNVLAWLLSKEGKRDEAIAVLSRGLKADSADEGTIENLQRLQNDKKMTMKSFGDLWYMLKFETPRGYAPPNGMAMPPVRKGFRQPPKPTKKEAGRR